MVILGIGSIAVLLAVLVVLRAAKNAPVGRQDEQGYH
jgi:hypothetical protein